MADKHLSEFVANPYQKAFIESRAPADLFASRVGEGKSTALAWSAFQHAYLNPHDEFVVMRDTYENLKRSTLKTFMEWFPPGVYGTWKETDKRFSWASGISEGSGVVFMGFDDPADASKLLSWELGGFAMDEPAPAIGSAGISEDVFDLAMTRLRKPNMKWYPAKLATNNPDETHWTFKKFAGPDKQPGFRLHQPPNPENVQNLPAGYYEMVRRTLAHRPDLVRRFVDGTFGFQQEGRAVTPQWSDQLHLATGLSPIPNQMLYMLWDFGHNPTCIITQRSPMGYWLILDSMVGEGIGVEELILNEVRPLLADRYRKGHAITHIGDPTGMTGEQTSVHRSAVKALRKALGGTWRPGPVKKFERIDPLQAVLSRNIMGRGIVQVDRHRAQHVWHALRGGWHYSVSKTGVISGDPIKDAHSHPGDAMGYGAAILFPMAKAALPNLSRSMAAATQAPSYWQSDAPWRIGPEERPGELQQGDKLIVDRNFGFR